MPKIIKTKISGNKKSSKKYSVKTNYIISASKGFAIALIGLFIVSFLLYKNNSFTLFNKLIIYLSIALGGFVAGLSAHNRLRGRGFINGIIASAIYIALLSFILILVLKLNFSAHMLIIYPVAILSGFVGGVVKA